MITKPVANDPLYIGSDWRDIEPKNLLRPDREQVRVRSPALHLSSQPVFVWAQVPYFHSNMEKN